MSKTGAKVSDGDEMIDPYNGLIYEHHGPDRFVTWEEAMKKARAQTPEELLESVLMLLDGAPLVLNALKRWHESLEFNCIAHSEGQNCCVDDLLEGGENRERRSRSATGRDTFRV